DAELQMPPGGKLADAEIALLEEWVRLGAPDPRDDSAPRDLAVDREAASAHWAYQPLGPAPRPEIRDSTWPLGEIDAFILAALEEKEPRPSRDAERHAWLRRVSFDLVGLPPTPDEIDAFLEEPNPEVSNPESTAGSAPRPPETGR